MRVAVVIVNWNGGALLDRCLAALEAQTRAPDRLVLVDNASTDGSLERAGSRHPAAQVIRLAENAGFAAAVNLGVTAAVGCEWVALLNTDAFPEPAWLEALLTAAREHPQYACFGSRMLSARDPGRLDGTGDVYHVSGLVWRRGVDEPSGTATEEPEIFSACAASALYNREAFLAVGGFDPDYFCYVEDVDLGFRLRLAGHRSRYVAHAVVHHVGSASVGRRSDFAVYHGHRNLVWTYFKSMPPALLWRYLPQHLLLNLATLAWFTWHGQGRAAWQAKWDALRGLPRVLRKRRELQGRRRVPVGELRAAMARDWLLPYRRGRGPAQAFASGAAGPGQAPRWRRRLRK